MLSKNVQEMIPKIKDYLASQPIEKAWLFGSCSRGEENAQSDIDILVKYKEGARVTLMTISRIMVNLSDVLRKQVDLVEEGRLLPFAKQNVEHDKILIYEREN